MGFFGSSSKTYYNSSSSYLFTEVPGILKQTIRGAILENRNIAEDLKANLFFGIGYKALALHNYGRQEYHWGLPDSTAITHSSQIPANIKLVIERQIGQIVYLNSSIVETNALNQLVYQASYFIVNSGVVDETQEYFWEYNESTGVYPTLDLNPYEILDVSPYYPIIPIRVNNVDLTDVSQPYHEDIVRACSYLNLDAKDLANEVADAGSTKNPVEDAHVVLSVNINEKTQVGLEYLYRFFEHHAGLSKVKANDYAYWLANKKKGDTYAEGPPINTIQLSDSTFKLELGWLFIEQTINIGLVDSVDGNTFASGVTTESTTKNYFGFIHYYHTDTFWIKKQISPTQYSTFSVVGLTYSSWATSRELYSTVREAFEEDDDGIAVNFAIPLRKDLVKAMGPIKSHDLMYRAIRLVVSDKNKVKLKWYQTGIFKIAIILVGIAITLLNPPAGVAVLSAAMAINIIISLIINLIIIPLATAALTDILGEELALIVSIVAAFFLGGGDFSNISVGDAANASVKLGSGLNNIQTANRLTAISNAIDELNEEISDYTDLANERAMAVNFAVGVSKSDAFALMEPSTYVDKVLREPKIPTYINYTVSNYVDIMQYLDKPSSNFNLGNRIG